MNKYIEKQIFDGKIDLQELVTAITDIDIERYVNKRISEVCHANNDYTSRLSENMQEKVIEWLLDKGYEVIPVSEYIERLMYFMSINDKLEVDNKRLRHNVSKLQKKINERNNE